MYLEQHWHHWLDHSATGSLCIGPCTTETLRWKSIQSPESGQACPLGTKISNTAVMVAALHTKVGNGNPGNVYLVLQLPQKCLHCKVGSSGKWRPESVATQYERMDLPVSELQRTTMAKCGHPLYPSLWDLGFSFKDRVRGAVISSLIFLGALQRRCRNFSKSSLPRTSDRSLMIN